MTKQEAELIQKRFSNYSIVESKDGSYSLVSSTNGGFGHHSVSKIENKFISYSNVPGSWDMDTGRVDYYREYKVEYETIEDLISGKNGKVLIDN